MPVVIIGGLIFSPAPLRCPPLELLAPLDSYSRTWSGFESECESNSKTVAVFDSLFLAPSRLMSTCSHRRRDTLAPGRCVDRSQRSRIGRITIYCATVFCLLVKDFLIPL